MTANFDSMAPDFSLAPRTHLPHSSNHFVELYDDDRNLIHSVARFISLGIGKGEAAVIIATEAHRNALEEALASRGIDVEALTDRRLYYALDAAETLELFMVDGLPDPAKFEKIFGGIIDRASGSAPHIRIFGEMVAELWTQNNVTSALRLEDLWNDLADAHPYRLFCAYPVHDWGEQSHAPLRSICQKHTHVIAAEGTTL